jgi:hypothetical protein
MTAPHPDPVTEARRVVAAAEHAGIPLRVLGGIGVALVAPSITRLTPARHYHDLDLMAPAGTSRPLERLFAELGYMSERRFNALNGAERLLFHDPSGRRVDVFLEVLRMCHVLPVGKRLEVAPMTLPPADLLLSKLQIVELTDRDVQDTSALLADHPVVDDDRPDGTGLSLRRLVEVCGRDWGWWRTVDGNLEQLIRRWSSEASPDENGHGAGSVVERAHGRAHEVRLALAAAPKSVAWRARARIGERRRWYDLPEEVR